MPGKLLGARDDVAAQPVHQLSECGELALGRMGRLEVADEANTNCRKVDTVAFYMAAEELLFPTRADLNLAVAGVDAVADDEVVGEAILHTTFSMGAVVNDRVAVFDCTVVHDDALPVAGADADTSSFCSNFGQEIFTSDSARDL